MVGALESTVRARHSTGPALARSHRNNALSGLNSDDWNPHDAPVELSSHQSIAFLDGGGVNFGCLQPHLGLQANSSLPGAPEEKLKRNDPQLS